MADREDMLFDHTLENNKKSLENAEIRPSKVTNERISSDLNFTLQHLIMAVQNLDDRIQELEEELDES